MTDPKRPDDAASSAMPPGADVPDALPSDPLMRETDLELRPAKRAIRLIPRDRREDIMRANGGGADPDGVAASYVERHERGRTGTGLRLEDVRVVDTELETLRNPLAQIAFVQVHLGGIVNMSDAPYEEEPAAKIAVAFMEQTDRVNGRDIAVVMRVLRGHVEPEPDLLRAAVSSIAQAHERWELKRLAAELDAPRPVEAPLSEAELDERVLDEALDHRDLDVECIEPVPPPPDMTEVSTGESLLTQDEQRRLDEAAQTLAQQGDLLRQEPVPPMRLPSARRRNKHVPVLSTPSRPALKPKAASARALWTLGVLLFALVAVVTAYLQQQNVATRHASETRDERQDVQLSDHEARLISHADTLARLVPALAEKDARIIDLRSERDGYKDVAIESQDSIRELDRRVGRQVGGLAQDLSETRAEMRRQRQEQDREIRELRAALEEAKAQEIGDATPDP